MITIIPAIDIISGKCVRLSEGDFTSKKIYSDNPLAMAQMFEEQGIKRLHRPTIEKTNLASYYHRNNFARNGRMSR